VFRLDLAPGAKQVEQLHLPALNVASLIAPQREFSRLIPPRLAYAPANLIDLSPHYNAAFSQTWHPGTENSNLEMLLTGVLQLGGTAFDARGIVQLAGKRLEGSGAHYPQQILDIKIGQTCRYLHFLQGAGWQTTDGTPVAKYVVHYVNGKEQQIPLIYGEDLRDWNAAGDTSTKLTRASIVWRAQNYARFPVRLFKLTWSNPFPELEITKIDFVSAMADAAPFVIGITAEQ
jgi:hypothetical protein